MKKYELLMIAGFVIVFTIIMVFGVTYGYNSTQLNIDCDAMMYSDNWTLGYLRNISALCSNGG